MKEKTFSELLKPHQKRLDWHNQNRIWIDKADVLNLLHQVREATIAECRESTIKEHKTFKGYYQLPLDEQLYNLNKLPTDRIKLTEKSTVCSNQKRYIESQKDEDGYFRK